MHDIVQKYMYDTDRHCRKPQEMADAEVDR